ncbi:glycohydrolase toxin TNT-related protein [Clostridium paraputrificum]|uniref:glycohydrolase toxin TNT-related protein n=1 Tax=Clostridium paraputrificum TaxID=29363 RepID=UPI003D341C7B
MAKSEFKNVMKSKGDGIKSVISNISEQNGEIKITLKDGIGDVKKIIFRSEELTPYQRYVCFNGCFTADTLVVTENGYKEISSIVDGELVLARDEMTEDIGYKKAKLIQKLAEELVVVTVNIEIIQATKDHLFMTDKGWGRAGELKEGDKLLTWEEIYRTIENIEKTGYNKGKVYNLEVEDYHTFYISKLGLLVHNDYSITELKDIYKKFNSSIKDVGLKAEFKTMLDKLENLPEGKIKDNFLKDFHGKFEGITGADDAGIKKIIEDVNGKITEGVSKPADIKSIKTMLTTGNLDDVYKYINNSSLKSVNNDSIDIIFKSIDKGTSNTVENISLKKAIVEKALKDGSKIDTLVPASIDFLDETSGWIKWPANDGFILELEKGNRPIKSLGVGEIIDRFGRETGNYVSPKYPAVTYEQRALPYLKNPNAYHQYEILKPIPGVEYGEIAAAFGQSGGGVQYVLPESLKYYLDNGFIREVFK